MVETKISLESDRGRLRLRLQYEKKRLVFYTGLVDSKTNRLNLRKTLILQIEADLEQGTFDPTFDKYRKKEEYGSVEMTVAELYKQWLDYKATHRCPRTVEWLRGTLSGSLEHLGERIARNVSQRDAQSCLTAFKRGSPSTNRRKLENLTACWKWR